MAASFVNNGGIEEKMFSDANGEHIGVFSKVELLIGEIREMIGFPDYLGQLEALVRRTPNSAQRLERMRGVFARWSKSEGEALAAG